MNKYKSTLEEAQEIVNGARQKDYGTPWVNHGLTAKYWEVLFGISISAEQVCVANILQKIARESNAYKRDNFVDMAGYAENANLCAIEDQRIIAERVAQLSDFGLCEGPFGSVRNTTI